MDTKDELSRLRQDLGGFMETTKQSQQEYEYKLDHLSHNVNYFIELMSKHNEITYAGDDDVDKDEMYDGDNNEMARYPDLRLTLESSSSSTSETDDEVNEEITRDCFVVLDRHAVGRYIDLSDEGLSSSNSDDVPLGKLSEKLRSTLSKLNSGEIEGNLEALRESDAVFCRKAETTETPLPTNYLKDAAVRGWTLQQTRQKFAVDRNNQSKGPALNEVKIRSRKFKKRAKKKMKISPPSSLLNPTDEQYQANLLALRERYEANKEKYTIVLNDYYFEYGAARGYTMGQLARRYYYEKRLKETELEESSAEELKKNASIHSVETPSGMKRKRTVPNVNNFDNAQDADNKLSNGEVEDHEETL